MASDFERISRRGSLAAACATLAVAAAGLIPTTASAGRFHVYSCRTPGGESAPVDGWSGSKTGLYTLFENTCARPGGALMAALRGQREHTPYADAATWAFGAPPPESLVAATLWRAGDAGGGAATSTAYEFWFAGPVNNIERPADNFGQCEGGAFC